LRGTWNGDRALENDVRRLDLFAIDLFVGVVVRAHGGSCERNTGEESAVAGVAQHLGTQCDVGIRRGGPALGTGGGGSIGTELHFAAENGACPAGIHHEKHEVGCLATELKANAGAFEGHHRWSAPGAGEMLTCAARHGTAAVAAADDKRGFQNRRINDDAFGLVDQVLGNVVRNIHDLLKDDPAIFQTIGFFFVFAGSGERSGKDDDRGQECCEFLHDAFLHGIDFRLNGPGLGACKPSNPVSADERLIAGACLEEVLRNVSTILVAVTIFQRGPVVEKKRRWRWNSEVALALAVLVVWVSPSFAQNRAKHETKGAEPSLSLLEEEKLKFTTRAAAILSAEQPAKGEWGVLIVEAKTGQVLFEQNADRYFVPASNMKLLTTALALAMLGPDYRFRTTLEAQTGASSDGKINGPLYFVGRGDPNLSNRKFPFDTKEEFDGPPEKTVIELVDQLVAAGVKEIGGDIVGDDSYFPRERYPDGWEIDDMVWEYGAAVSAIIINDNTVALTLTPSDVPGEPVRAEIAPATPDFIVTNLVTTSAASLKSDLTLKREPGSNTVTVSGTLPAQSKPRKLVLAVQEPAIHAAAMLKRLLEERGVKVDGVARAQSTSLDAKTAQERIVLASHNSVPLAEAVRLVNKISQNLHTESLLRTSARQICLQTKSDAEPKDCSALTTEDYAAIAAKFYADAGIAAGDVVQTDGSGLSRHDLVTPRAFVALLQYAAKQSWFPAFYDSLPVAGLDGTLEDRLKNSSATMRIHAKSGSVEHVRTRSGYAELPNGQRLIFSFMSNNMGSKGHEATDALDALSAAMVEEFGGEPMGCCRRKQ